MKEKQINIRVDNITMQMLKELSIWIKEDYKINPSNSEIIRSAIEQMHEKYYLTRYN